MLFAKLLERILFMLSYGDSYLLLIILSKTFLKVFHLMSGCYLYQRLTPVGKPIVMKNCFRKVSRENLIILFCSCYVILTLPWYGQFYKFIVGTLFAKLLERIWLFYFVHVVVSASAQQTDGFLLLVILSKTFLKVFYLMSGFPP